MYLLQYFEILNSEILNIEETHKEIPHVRPRRHQNRSDFHFP